MSQDSSFRPIFPKPPARSGAQPLVIGFVPMVDCAPLLVAQEQGLFARRGLHVTLSREVGWATIREKLLHEELHAAAAPASLAFVIRCGLGIVARPCLTGFVMGLNGSAITLSRELWEKGVRDAASLRGVLERERGHRTYRFGAVHEFSTQHYNLRRWLRSGGIDPDRDVKIPIIPSPVIHRGLLDGHLDGFCVGEPWNSLVTASGAGWVAATSSEIAPEQPEKVLLVLEKFAEEQPEEHLGLLAALQEASAFCEEPAHRPELVRILSKAAYLDVPEALLAPSLLGPFPLAGGGGEPRFITYHRGGANIPDRAKGRRIFDEVRAMPLARDRRSLRPDSIGRIFREDLYRQAQNLPRRAATSAPHSPALAFAL